MIGSQLVLSCSSSTALGSLSAPQLVFNRFVIRVWQSSEDVDAPINPSVQVTEEEELMIWGTTTY